MKNVLAYIERKTYKREFAAALLIVLIVKIYQGHTEMVEVIVWPILSFVAIAAGLKGYENISFVRQSSAPPPSPPVEPDPNK